MDWLTILLAVVALLAVIGISIGVYLYTKRSASPPPHPASPLLPTIGEYLTSALADPSKVVDAYDATLLPTSKWATKQTIGEIRSAMTQFNMTMNNLSTSDLPAAYQSGYPAYVASAGEGSGFFYYIPSTANMQVLTSTNAIEKLSADWSNATDLSSWMIYDLNGTKVSDILNMSVQ
jgi:hypothetical protein